MKISIDQILELRRQQNWVILQAILWNMAIFTARIGNVDSADSSLSLSPPSFQSTQQK